MKQEIAKMSKEELELYQQQLLFELTKVNFFLRGKKSKCIPDENATNLPKN